MLLIETQTTPIQTRYRLSVTALTTIASVALRAVVATTAAAADAAKTAAYITCPCTFRSFNADASSHLLPPEGAATDILYDNPIGVN